MIFWKKSSASAKKENTSDVWGLFMKWDLIFESAKKLGIDIQF
jgi:hypothetical protein